MKDQVDNTNEGENVVVQRNGPSLVFSTWSFIDSQIKEYAEKLNTTLI